MPNEQAALTLNAIGDAVLSTDILGRVTYLNPVAERMTGWSPAGSGRPAARRGAPARRRRDAQAPAEPAGTGGRVRQGVRPHAELPPRQPRRGRDGDRGLGRSHSRSRRPGDRRGDRLQGRRRGEGQVPAGPPPGPPRRAHRLAEPHVAGRPAHPGHGRGLAATATAWPSSSSTWIDSST
ncbi:MAG: PAS domain-containing protein [Comamonadaceae bacterium]|nr:PAS domain-containing protein [Comamonadaceae bacterium]